jgi:predicted RNase H-like HicB family nuclease
MKVTDKMVEDILAKGYSRIVIPEEDGRFFAEVLEFQGCVSQGDTPAEAYANINEAAANWVRSTLEHGGTVPEPLAGEDASGRFALRLPRSLHARLVKLAARERVSVNQCIVNALSESVATSELADVLESRVEAIAERLSSAFVSPQGVTGTNREMSPLASNPVEFASTGTGFARGSGGVLNLSGRLPN